MITTPSLIGRLDPHGCIDTRWIAFQTGRKLNHIHEAVRKIEDGRSFGLRADTRGYVTCMWLPLSDALILLSQFEGEKAVKARALIREALEFYLHDRPRLLEEIRELTARLGTQKTKALPGPRSGKLPMPIVQNSMFGDAPVVHYVMMTIEGAAPEILNKGRLRHLQRQMEGIAKQVNALQRRLDGEITQ